MANTTGRQYLVQMEGSSKGYTQNCAAPSFCFFQTCERKMILLHIGFYKGHQLLIHGSHLVHNLVLCDMRWTSSHNRLHPRRNAPSNSAVAHYGNNHSNNKLGHNLVGSDVTLTASITSYDRSSKILYHCNNFA